MVTLVFCTNSGLDSETTFIYGNTLLMVVIVTENLLYYATGKINEDTHDRI